MKKIVYGHDSNTAWSHGDGANNSLGFALSQLGLETARQFSLVVGEFGLEPRHFAVLFALSRGDEQSQQTVGEKLSIPASSMVAIIDHLESGELVERRPHASDRRTRSLHLTKKGHNVLAKSLDRAALQEAKINQGISPSERSTLLLLLRKISDNLGVPPAALPDRGSGERPEA
jgi:MarR family transcriptional regulator for hemolysin